jgi:hypothetical protein
MQKILKVTVLLSISLSAYSQDFEVGSYVKEGKKIEGYIKYYDWRKSPKSIEFKANLESPEIKIEAESIEGFSVHGEDFIAKSISISLSPNRPKIKEKPYNHTIEGGYFFLQIWLKTANINLYEMIDSKKESHFFVDKDGRFQELFYTKYFVDNGSIYYLQEQKGYIGQLSVLMADCEKMVIPERLVYSRNSLLKLCKTYLACKGTDIAVEQKLKKDQASFSVGLSAGRMLNDNEHFNLVTNLVVRLNFPRRFRNAYVQLEMNRYHIFDNRVLGGSYEFKNGLGGSVYAGSHFGNKNFRPFANIGIQIVPTLLPISLPSQLEITPFSPIICGVGISWKRSLKIEYRDNLSGLSRQLIIGYMINF